MHDLPDQVADFLHLLQYREPAEDALASAELAYFIGIDAEWYESGGQNIVLSYQIATVRQGLANNIIQYCHAGERLTLLELIELGIRSVHDGDLPHQVRHQNLSIAIISHNFTAEWSVISDRDEDIIQKRLALIRKTTVTDGHWIKLVLDRSFPIDVQIFDTMLLAPMTHRSLKKLATLLGDEGAEKIPISQYYIEHMDRLLEDKPEEYRTYALRDSELCLKLFFLLQRSLNELAFGTGPVRKLYRTLASAAVTGFIKRSEYQWFTVYRMGLGLAKPGMKVGHRELLLECAETFRRPYQLVRRAYFGGRNESYFVGNTANFQESRDRVWVDFDFSGCYPTCMSLVPMINLVGKVDEIPLRYAIDEAAAERLAAENVPLSLIDQARGVLAQGPGAFAQWLDREVKSRRLAKALRQQATVVDNRLVERWQAVAAGRGPFDPTSYLIPGFARIRFRFPADTTFPCLPVRHVRYGLIYPLAGETVASASEILLALEIGAQIEALSSVELPVVLGNAAEKERIQDWQTRPQSEDCDYASTMKLLARLERLSSPYCFFSGHLRQVLQQRKEYQQQKDDPRAQVMEKLLKEFANSFYGKFAQAINPRKTYRPSTGEMAPLFGSPLTEPCAAALTTSLARAALSGALVAIERFNRSRQAHQQVVVISATTDGFLLGLPAPPGYSVEPDYFVDVEGVPKLKSEVKRSLELDDQAKAAMRAETVLERFGCSALGEELARMLPIRQLMHARQRLTGSPEYLEVKNLVDEVVSVKTRGQIGLLASGAMPLLARFGHKPPLSDLFEDREEYKKVMDAGGTLRNTHDGQWLLGQLARVENGLERIVAYKFITLASFRQMRESSGELDLVKRERQQRVNTDYDWKRRIVQAENPFTAPFADIREMVMHRGQMESVRRSGRIARPEQVLHRVKLKTRSTRERDGEAVTLARHFLRGVRQEKIPLAETLTLVQMAELVNQVWADAPAAQQWPKVWTVDDLKNAKRATLEPGVLRHSRNGEQLLAALCAAFGAELAQAASLLFVAPEYLEENLGQIRAVIQAVLLAPHHGIEPFFSLHQQGKLPHRSELLALFRPLVTESMIADWMREPYRPGERFGNERPQLERIFRRLGLPAGQAQACARNLAPPLPRQSKPRRNPGERRCLESFVQALQQADLLPHGPKPGQVIERLARFGLTRGRYYALLQQRFVPHALNHTQENRQQIRAMARALGIAGAPLQELLLHV